jgi:hypothetical protein
MMSLDDVPRPKRAGPLPSIHTFTSNSYKEIPKAEEHPNRLSASQVIEALHKLSVEEETEIVFTELERILRAALRSRETLAALPNMLRAMADRLEGKPQSQEVLPAPSSQSFGQAPPHYLLLYSLGKYFIEKVLDNESPIAKGIGKAIAGLLARISGNQQPQESGDRGS